MALILNSEGGKAMHRWTFYLYAVFGVAVLGFWADKLPNQEPVLALAQEEVHPWVRQAYETLRAGEIWIFGVVATVLAPFIVGRRKPLENVLDHFPTPGAIGLATLWHYLVFVAGGIFLLYIWHPWSPQRATHRFVELLNGWENISRVREAIPIELGTPALVLVSLMLYLMLWRHPLALNAFLHNMLLPALLLVDGLTLLALAALENDSWLWSGLAGLFSPVTALWIFFLASKLRRPGGGKQLFELVMLLVLSVPVAGAFGMLFRYWPHLAPEVFIINLPSILSTQIVLPTVRDLLIGSAIGVDLLFLFLTGVVCRRSGEHAQQIERYTAKLSLPRLRYHLPRRTYPFVEIEPPRTGFTVLDIPLAVFFTLVERLANATMTTLHTLDTLITVLLDWLLHLAYTLVAIVYNFIVFMVVHLIYTLVHLPALMLEALSYLLDAVDVVIRRLIFPPLTYILAAVGLMITVHTAVSYFLVGQPGLLLWGLWGTAALLLGLIFGLSAVTDLSPGDAAYWYLLGLVEYLPYPMVLLTALLWIAIIVGPRYGIEHFQAGIVTWALTGPLIGVLPYAWLFGKKENRG